MEPVTAGIILMNVGMALASTIKADRNARASATVHSRANKQVAEINRIIAELQNNRNLDNAALIRAASELEQHITRLKSMGSNFQPSTQVKINQAIKAVRDRKEAIYRADNERQTSVNTTTSNLQQIAEDHISRSNSYTPSGMDSRSRGNQVASAYEGDTASKISHELQQYRIGSQIDDK